MFPTLPNDRRGQTSIISYVLIVGLVIGIAGGAVMIFDSVGNPIAGQQGTEFVVDRTPDAEYQLIYVGDETLDSSNTDVLELSNENNEVLTTPPDWPNNTLERGDMLHSNLTADFAHGSEVNVIGHEEASIESGTLRSQSGGERLQSVIVRRTDPEELDDADIPDDIFVDDPTESGSGIDIIVE